jgi:hypothetical protein
LIAAVYDAVHHEGALAGCNARKEGDQTPSGLALPFSGARGTAPAAHWPRVSFSSLGVFSARADAAAIARLDGVSVCEGNRVFGATVPSCGSGFVLARAGKALWARGRSARAAQSACGGALPGFPSCGSAPAGSPATMAASSTGMFIALSFKSPF